MKLLRIGPAGEERPAVLLGDGRAVGLPDDIRDYDAGFFADGGIQRVRNLVEGDTTDLPAVDLDGTRIGPPIARPGKVVCIGLNYADHAAESGAALPSEPTVFFKAPNAIVGPYDDVLIPRGGEKTDWEIELAVVVGSTARYLPDTEAAWSSIAGYAIANDVSERAFQLERGGQWVKGKSCETFNPLGPWLVLADEVPDPQALAMRLSVNGEVMQDSTTKSMVFDVAHIVWYLSQFMVLEPGDLINTGTPAGVAHGMAVPRFLHAGDVMELEIDGLGRQRQTCRDA